MTRTPDNDFLTIFIFPFKYGKNGKGGDETASPADVSKMLVSVGWKEEEFTLFKEENYNEYFYFHPHVHKTIYSRKGDSGMKFLTRKDYNKIEVEYLEEKVETNSGVKTVTYKPKSLVASIESIDLHIYENDIGLLTVTVEKLQADGAPASFNEVLLFNDLARRVYMPFLGVMKEEGDDTEYYGGLEKRIVRARIKRTQNEYLSDNSFAPKSSKMIPSRVVFTGPGVEPLDERFNTIDLSQASGKTYFLSDIIKGLLNPLLLWDSADEKKRPDSYFVPYIDDRMFVVSFYSDDILSWRMKQKSNRRGDEYVYETSDDWYKLVFVDGGYKGVANGAMMKELIKRHTYARWADYGTLFGMSRYSLVALCDGSGFSERIKTQMKSMYYQMALIVLFQRAMLLKFTEDVDVVAKLMRSKNPDFSSLRERFERLHGDFLKFTSMYWFVEVSPQEQGTEMYNQMMSIAGITGLNEEVRREISGLAEFVEGRVEFETNEKVAKITEFGLPIAVAALIMGVWQIFNSEIVEFMCGSSWASFIAMLIVVISLAGVSYICIRYRRKGRWRDEARLDKRLWHDPRNPCG